jgi:hypothetical protein
MATDDRGEHPPPPQAPRTSPVISATRGQVLITGTGFLPNCPVTIRITCSADDIVDYVTYITDADGSLSAALPETALTETEHITVTDHPRLRR